MPLPLSIPLCQIGALCCLFLVFPFGRAVAGHSALYLSTLPMVPCLICFLQSAISIPVRAAQRRGPGTSWKSPLWPRRLQAAPRAREHRPKLAHLEQPARSRCRRCLWRRAPWSPRPETRWPARAQRIQKHSAMNQNRCAWLSSKMFIVLQRPNFPLVTMAMRSAGTLRRSCR